MFDSPPRELLEARENVEPAVASLCAGRIPADELARLADLINECEREAKRAPRDQYEEFLRLSHQFHYALALNCGNSILSEMTSRLVDVSAHRLWMIVNGLHVREQDERASQAAEHRAVLEAIAADDPAGAADAMWKHLIGLEDRIFGPSRSKKVIRPRRG